MYYIRARTFGEAFFAAFLFGVVDVAVDVQLRRHKHVDFGAFFYRHLGHLCGLVQHVQKGIVKLLRPFVLEVHELHRVGELFQQALALVGLVQLPAQAAQFEEDKGERVVASVQYRSKVVFLSEITNLRMYDFFD